MSRRYGRGKKGERVSEGVIENKGKNITMIGTLGEKGIEAEMVIEGGMDGEVFIEYVRQMLCPTLEKRDIVVMDNLSAHKVKGIKELIEARGAEIRYLPPYSPDLNPIEQCWSKVKTYLRKIKAETKELLEEAIGKAFETITKSDAQGWFGHCGYT